MGIRALVLACVAVLGLCGGSLTAHAQGKGTPVSPAAAPAPVVPAVINLTMDQSRVLRVPNTIATLIVGNPAIADATVSRNGMLVLTAKGYGRTNLVGLDANGQTLFDAMMDVAGGGMAGLRVYRGQARNSYACNPVCTPTVAVGDEKDYFASTIEQTAQRSEAANGQYVSSKSADSGVGGGFMPYGAGPTSISAR